MAWTAPMTAVANTAFTAAQFNTNVRDNLLETAPAKATQVGSIFVGAGANQIVERTPQISFDSGPFTTTSTTYTDLSTFGPSVTVETGTNAFVSVSCAISNSASNASSYVGLSVTGDTGSSLTPSDINALSFKANSAGDSLSASYVTIYTSGLNAGNNTFTMKYRVSAGTGTFTYRRLVILPF